MHKNRQSKTQKDTKSRSGRERPDSPRGRSRWSRNAWAWKNTSRAFCSTCRGRPVHKNGLALTFRDAAFSGWTTRAGRGRPAVTAGGLGPGAPEAPLPEGLSARFESGVVVALSAGAPCIRG